ncbi:MAG: carbon monoxide dehydrogenase subunit G, partial [Actinomycetota bacterium]|nr:carbon monoxide dehydrogenase subunit G [Actinomycetota bacterium]
PFPVAAVWDALLDPRVLVRTIPGCERLEATGDNTYAMTVTAGVAAIRGTYDGSCTLSNLKQHESLVMRLQGAGAPGTVDATVDVRFEDLGAEGTRISYDADAIVGGMVGGVGQRMLASVSKRMAGEFFGNVGAAIGAPQPTAVPAGPTTEAAGVFTAPPPPAGVGNDFVKGIAVGAGLVLLGVVAGSIFGRRR